MGEEKLYTVGQRLRTTLTTIKSSILFWTKGDRTLDALEDACQRFDLWAINLGLYTSGHSSLAYRLGDAPLVYEYAARTLEDLHSYLEISMRALSCEDVEVPSSRS